MKSHFLFGQFNISGITLLRLLQEILKDYDQTFRLSSFSNSIEKSPDIILNPQTKPIEITLKTARGWAICLGQLSDAISGHDVQQNGTHWFPCHLVIGTEKNAPRVELNTKGLVELDSKILSYEEITSYLKKIPVSQEELAEIILNRISGSPYPENWYELPIAIKFLDSLIVLMLGVESSRNNATLLTSLMLLDLIKSKQTYGSRQQVFSWCNAFVSEHGYKWDDYENKDYGGKFPMSQQSTGTGNLGQGLYKELGVLQKGRGIIFEQTLTVIGGVTFDSAGKPKVNYVNKYTCDEKTIQEEFDKYPQRHAVPRREITLIVHWLNSLADKTPLTQCQSQAELEAAIKKVFKQRLDEGLGFTPKSHKDSWLTALPNKIDNNPKSEVVSDASATKANGFIISHTLTQKENGRTAQYDKKNVYHRFDVRCKLIPGYIAEDEKKKLPDTKDNNVLLIDRSISGQISEIKTDQIIECCNYCKKQPRKKTYSERNTSTILMPIFKEPKEKIYHKYENYDEHVKQENPPETHLAFVSYAKKQGFFRCKTCWNERADTVVDNLSATVATITVSDPKLTPNAAKK